MENLFIEGTERTPNIEFDYSKNKLVISGEAYPENNEEFYKPIFDSLQSYLEIESKDEISFHFKLIYFNSSSARVIMKLFDLLDGIAEKGRKVNIEWHYQKEDDSMEEFGEDYSEDIEFASFAMKVIKNE